MNTTSIYEKLMLTDTIRQIKYVYNQWYSAEKADNVLKQPNRFCDVDGEDYRHYEFVIDRFREITGEMMVSVIKALIAEYNIQIQEVDLESHGCNVIINRQNRVEGLQRTGKHKKLLTFIREEKAGKVLYCLREYGVSNSIPDSIFKGLRDKYKLNEIRQVSLVLEDAYTEIISHNDDETDPARGTGIFSLKWFFEYFFGYSEFEKFKANIELLGNQIKDILGVAIVRTLKPNALYNFKKHVKQEVEKFAAELNKTPLNDDQKNVINMHLYNENNYLALIGNSDFAQSFMTAEWLYLSLGQAGNIDLTAIAMGYFKAIEQFLFLYISLLAKNINQKPRQIYVGKGMVPLTKEDLEEKKDYINLGGLTGFFGFRDKQTGVLYGRNRDLLYKDITAGTYEFIVDMMSEVSELRNTYFHKENITDWSAIMEDRNRVWLLLCLFLGSYKIEDRQNMGIPEISPHDNYYHLCEYINQKAYNENNLMEIPVFSFNDNMEQLYLCQADTDMEYDTIGDPVYSGVYFKRMMSKDEVIMFDRESVPNKISEGCLIISDSTRMKIQPKGLVYENGLFIR